MSGADDEAANLPEPYRVGYKRPPAEHRFRKGRSGNPNGRPRGSANKPRIDTGYGARAADEFLRAEAYRAVSIREGDQVIELPAIQAVFRALGVSAMKGNRLAQRTFAELVQGLEEAEYKSKLEYFETFFDYKHEWGEAIERAIKLGLEIPDPTPHPGDIELDFNNGTALINGPATKEQKARLDELLQRRSDAQEEVTHFADQYRRARTEKQKAQWLEEWHWEQGMFDLLNDMVPGRYKTKLEDRSFREGASREGKQLEKVRRESAEREKFVK